MAQSADECAEALWVEGMDRLMAGLDLPRELVADKPPLPHTVGCHNSQCRVVEFYPTSDGTGRCPACYGV